MAGEQGHRVRQVSKNTANVIHNAIMGKSSSQVIFLSIGSTTMFASKSSALIPLKKYTENSYKINQFSKC